MIDSYPEPMPTNNAALSIYTNRAGPLGKHFERAPDGRVTKTARAELAEGNIARREVVSLADFAELRRGLTADQALGYGVSDHHCAELMASKALSRLPQRPSAEEVPIVARTKEYLHWPAGAGIWMLDHDPLPGGMASTAEELYEAYCSAWPALRHVEMLWTPSVGSNVRDAVTGEELVPLRGSRMYILVDDASVIPAAGRLLFDRLVLNGHGAIVLSGNGRMLERTLIDAAVWEPTRLDFVRPTCAPGLDWQMQPGRFFGPSGGTLRAEDVRRGALDVEERRRLTDVWVLLRAQKADAAKSKREDWAQMRARESLGPDATADQIESRARNVADAVEGGRLDASHKLYLQNGREITVADVLADPDAFDGLKLCDPAEPDYRNDNRIATIRVAHDGSITIGSYAHGWSSYEIRGRSTADEDLAGVDDGDVITTPAHHAAKNDASHSSAKLRVWRPGELASRQPPQWLVRGWFPEQGVVGLVGDSNVGKSFLTLQLCISGALGSDWLGMTVKQGGALYVAAEGGFGMQARLAAIERHYGVSLENAPFGLVTEGLDLRSTNKDADRVIDAACDLATDVGQPVKIIVLDTLARMMAGGDENSSVDMGSLINSATRIAEKTGALVVLVHHTGKDASKGARGHSSLRAALDAQIVVEKHNGDFVMRVDKQRDGPTDLRVAYRLLSVELGATGDDLESTSSAVVVRADAVLAPPGLHLQLWETYALNAWQTATIDYASPTLDDVMEHAMPTLERANKVTANCRSMINRALKQLVRAGVLADDDGEYSAGPELTRVKPNATLH